MQPLAWQARTLWVRRRTIVVEIHLAPVHGAQAPRSHHPPCSSPLTPSPPPQSSLPLLRMSSSDVTKTNRVGSIILFMLLVADVLVGRGARPTQVQAQKGCPASSAASRPNNSSGPPCARARLESCSCGATHTPTHPAQDQTAPHRCMGLHPWPP